MNYGEKFFWTKLGKTCSGKKLQPKAGKASGIRKAKKHRENIPFSFVEMPALGTRRCRCPGWRAARLKCTRYRLESKREREMIREMRRKIVKEVEKWKEERQWKM